MTVRATDHPPGLFRRLLILWRRFGRDLFLAVALGASFLSIHQSSAEGEKRRDQACRIDETKEAKDIRQLERTYEFLAKAGPADFADPDSLAAAVLPSLAEIEDDAHTPDAAPYCNAPGVGLPEKVVIFPQRPLNVPPVPAVYKRPARLP